MGVGLWSVSAGLGCGYAAGVISVASAWSSFMLC